MNDPVNINRLEYSVPGLKAISGKLPNLMFDVWLLELPRNINRKRGGGIMTLERRCSSIPDRRARHGTDSPQARVAGSKPAAPIKAPTPSNEALVSNPQNSTLIREEVMQSREGSSRLREDTVLARENAAQERETTASLREESITSREQEIHDKHIVKAAQQDRNAKLKQANEQLVITSVQLQIATEEIERSKAEMTHLANHDFLTDLPNRMQLHDRIGQAIARAKRYQTKLAVLFLDLDRFKIVNDSLGHAIGDKLLQSVAQRLKGAIRATDTVSRHGGDEFVLLLSEVDDCETLALTIEKIHKIITASYDIAGHDLDIGATIGISMFPEDGEDSGALIRNADAAMYFAKENGRNKYQFFEHEMRARNMARQDIETNLRQALDKHQFVLFYQAQINLESGDITGAEALIRWRQPNGGLLLPAWFMPVAEDCGAIVQIGRWVLREACREAQSWLEADLPFNVIAVNISAREFESDDFLAHVHNVLLETGLTADRLELELTETVLMKNIESTVATLHALRSMGVRISIDDFGTGYSSLSYLKQFPLDTLKIDQSFVRDISISDNDVLVDAVIGIGKGLRLQVVAEGVETAAQLAFLRTSHCATVQGFYLNVPMIAEDFSAFLQRGVPAHILNST